MSTKILIVEDNVQFRDVLIIALSDYDCSVETATSGTEGLEKFFAQTPDLVVLDIMLPEMDGFAVCDIIRKSPQGQKIPIIVMTAVYKTESYRKKMLQEMKVQAFLEKPFTIKEFLIVVSGLLPVQARKKGGSPQKKKADLVTFKDNFSNTKTFPRLFYRMFKENLTGILTLTQGKIVKLVYFVNGSPVYVDSNVPEEQLGHLLQKRGKLDEQELDRCWKIMFEYKIELGEAIIRQGLMNSVEFYREHREQMLTKLAYCYSWTSGSYHFQEDYSFMDKFSFFDFNTLVVIRHCVKVNRNPYDVETRLKKIGLDKQLIITENITAWKDLELSESEQIALTKAAKGLPIKTLLLMIEQSPDLAFLFDIFLELELCSPEMLVESTPEETEEIALEEEIIAESEPEKAAIAEGVEIPQEIDSEADYDQIRNQEDISPVVEDYTSSIIQQALGEIEALKQKKVDQAAREAEEISRTPEQADVSSASEQQEETPPSPDEKMAPTQNFTELLAKSDFELFELNRDNFTRNELTKKYFELADKYHPDKYMFEPDKNIRKQVQALFERIKKSFFELNQICRDDRIDVYTTPVNFYQRPPVEQFAQGQVPPEADQPLKPSPGAEQLSQGPGPTEAAPAQKTTSPTRPVEKEDDSDLVMELVDSDEVPEKSADDFGQELQLTFGNEIELESGLEKQPDSRNTSRRRHETNPEIAQLIEQGARHITEEKFIKAQKCFESALEIDPDNATVLAWKAWLLFLKAERYGLTGQMKDAIALCNTALEKDPSCEQAEQFLFQMRLKMP
ncbi:response regulator [bacterium]|nr:response regulator [bacterium]